MATTERGRPSDFALLLPAGWVRIPAGPGARSVITRLVNARFQDLPSGRRDQVRNKVGHELYDAAVAAQREGGIELLLCVDPVQGRAVGASCLVTYVAPPDGEGAVPLPLVGDALVDATGDAWTVVTVARAPAARRVRLEAARNEVASVEAASDEVAGRQTPAAMRVDYLVPVPNASGYLLLSFATVSLLVADAFVELFDAMATSLRWEWV